MAVHDWTPSQTDRKAQQGGVVKRSASGYAHPMIALLFSLALSPCQLIPADGPALIPAFADLKGAATWPCLGLGSPGKPTIIGVHVPSGAAKPAGLWLRSLDRGERVAARIHQMNSIVDQPPGPGCDRWTGQAVSCFRSAATVRWPMMALESTDRLWVAWVRRERTERHSLDATHRRASPKTLRSTQISDQLLAAPIDMRGPQWMQGPMRARPLPRPLPDGAQLQLTIRDGTPVAIIDGRTVTIGLPYASDTGALRDWSAFPPKAPPPQPPPKVCRDPQHMDCGEATCVDPRSSRKHCGSCGVDCGPHRCENGTCGPFCYTDADCIGKFPRFPRGQCYTPLVVLRGRPAPIPKCSPGSCGKWKRCEAGQCVALKCRTRADCPKGRVRCLPSGAGGRICVPRGQCVGTLNVP